MQSSFIAWLLSNSTQSIYLKDRFTYTQEAYMYKETHSSIIIARDWMLTIFLINFLTIFLSPWGGGKHTLPGTKGRGNPAEKLWRILGLGAAVWGPLFHSLKQACGGLNCVPPPKLFRTPIPANVPLLGNCLFRCLRYSHI